MLFWNWGRLVLLFICLGWCFVCLDLIAWVDGFGCLLVFVCWFAVVLFGCLLFEFGWLMFVYLLCFFAVGYWFWIFCCIGLAFLICWNYLLWVFILVLLILDLVILWFVWRVLVLFAFYCYGWLLRFCWFAVFFVGLIVRIGWVVAGAFVFCLF